MNQTDGRMPTMADRFAAMGLPVTDRDVRPGAASERLMEFIPASRVRDVITYADRPADLGQQGQPSQPSRREAVAQHRASDAQSYPVECEVLFRLPGGFTFPISFLTAVLDDRRQFLILALPEVRAHSFCLAGSAEQPMPLDVQVTSAGLRVVVESSGRSFSFVMDGLKFFVFPVTQDLSHTLAPGPPAVPEPEDEPEHPEGYEPAEEERDGPNGEADAETDVRPPADDEVESGYTGLDLRDVLFGPKSPRGE